MKPPSWWTENLDETRSAPTRALLRTAGKAYGSVAKYRERITTAYACLKPVICIGNFTVGGAGKTPLAIALARQLKAQGKSIAFLTRGYGGTTPGPHMVNQETDTAETIGDEPFLLARHAPVMVCADRPAGARILELVDCDAIIMDDGFQNPTLKKDLSICIADASVNQPFGNLEVMPAGPLRAPLDWQTEHADAVIVVSDDSEDVRRVREDIGFDKPGAPPMFRATIEPKALPDEIAQKKIIAFCGIGKPEKFFQTLSDVSLDVISHIAFDDHHPFTDDEAAELVERAQQTDAVLLTTTKDAVRIKQTSSTSAAMKKLAGKIAELEIEMSVIDDDRPRFDALIESVFSKN